MESNIQKLKGSVIGYTYFPATPTPQPTGLDKQERRLLFIAATKKTALQRRKNAAASFDKLVRRGLIDRGGNITEQGQKLYNSIKCNREFDY